MIEPRSIDHITLCVENLDEAEFLFTKILGFEVIWSARDVGTDKSSWIPWSSSAAPQELLSCKAETRP